MKRFLGHLKTVIIHRFWVRHYCFKLGLIWQGLTHDLSKYSPIEFWESVKYYTGTHSPIDECKKHNRYSAAWLHHKGRNKHHYEYWIDNFSKGGEAIEMPLKYKMEMFCDFCGAGRAYYGKDFTWDKEIEWWNKVKDERPMHPSDKYFIDECFAYINRVKHFPNYWMCNSFNTMFCHLEKDNVPLDKCRKS